MNRARAERCRCGHVFDPATIVKREAKRCPLCGLVAAGGAASCDCGYDFETAAQDVRPQLVRRKKYGWFWLAVGVTCVPVAGAMWLLVSVLPGTLIAAAGAWLIARGLHAVIYTRRALAQLEARDKALPEARVVT